MVHILNSKSPKDSLHSAGKYLTHFITYFVLIILLLSFSTPIKKATHYTDEYIKEKIIIKCFAEDSKNERVSNLVFKIAKLYNIDYYLFYAVIKTDSNFQENKHTSTESDNEYYGLMQLNINEYTQYTPTQLQRPGINLSLGAEKLKQAIEQAGNNEVKAIAFYKSSGVSSNKRHGKETLTYIENIFKEKERIKMVVDNYIKENYDL